MSPLETLLLLTANDIPLDTSFITETDCLMDAHVETDCACPDNGFSLAVGTPEINEAQLYHLPALETGIVDAHHYLIFNPLKNSGVVVLNQSAFEMMNFFAQPHYLTEGVQFAGNPVEGLAIARHMVALGLLEPVGDSKLPKYTQPQTLTAWVHITNDCNLVCSCF